MSDLPRDTDSSYPQWLCSFLWVFWGLLLLQRSSSEWDSLALLVFWNRLLLNCSVGLELAVLLHQPSRLAEIKGRGPPGSKWNFYSHKRKWGSEVGRLQRDRGVSWVGFCWLLQGGKPLYRIQMLAQSYLEWLVEARNLSNLLYMPWVLSSSCRKTRSDTESDGK